MPTYRIFRMKDNHRQRFRLAPHTAGCSFAKPQEYKEAGMVEAPSVYAAWMQVKASNHPLEVGDILVGPQDEMRIVKYVGIEEVRWLLPETKPEAELARPVQ
jgi:hypothetical protein